MTEFLPKDPAKALVEVKETLYERLTVLRTCILDSEKDDWGYIDPFDVQMNNEIEFLERLLDRIERS